MIEQMSHLQQKCQNGAKLNINCFGNRSNHLNIFLFGQLLFSYVDVIKLVVPFTFAWAFSINRTECDLLYVRFHQTFASIKQVRPRGPVKRSAL